METLLCKLKGVPNQIILCVQNCSYPKRQISDAFLWFMFMVKKDFI